MMTIRECEICKYQTFIGIDNLKKMKCKHCGGLLKIIKQELLSQLEDDEMKNE